MSVAAGIAMAGNMFVFPAFGQSDKDKATDDLQGVKRQLEQAGQREKQINRELTALEKEAREISLRLIALASKTQNSEGRISDTEDKIVRLDDQQKQLVAKLASRRDALGELLVGLQRLDRDPPPPLIVHPRDALAAIRSATLFGAIIPAIKAETTAIRRDLVVLKNVRTSLLTAQKDLKNENTSLESVRAELQALLARKKSFVKKTRKQLEEEQKRTARLVARAKNLNQLLARIRQEKIAAEKQKSEQARKQEAARRVKNLHPKVAFTRARGTLPFPARGRILRRFAEKNLLGQVSPGLLLGTRKQAQVTAPAGGVVEFAGKFRSYGQLLILNVGEGYRMLLGGLGKIDVTTGQQVAKGEPVGFMGEVAARGTLIAAALDVRQPVLYIELRKNGGPVDPSAWWLPEFKRSNVKRVEN
ncbi:MAG TPA: hypothetical protein ENJ55_07245 [Rhizobiales bacterium]|nr:hypothetical protein [Hyphomicrobiales bacterium]